MKKLFSNRYESLKLVTINAFSLLVELLPIKQQTVFADTYIWRYEPCFSCGPNVCYPPGQNYQLRVLWRYFRIGGFPVAVRTSIEECVQTC